MAPSTEITKQAIQTITQLAKSLDCSLLSYHAAHYPTTTRPGPRRYLFPTGPFAIGLYHPGDSVHLVCVTDNSASTFWAFAAERLEREDLPKRDCVVASASPDWGEVWLHYCNTPASFDLATLAEYGFGFSKDGVVTKAVQRSRDRLSDAWILTKAVENDADDFRAVYGLLRDWAETCGILSQHKALGLLDSDSLLWMLYHAGAGAAEAATSHNAMIDAFLEKYQHADQLTIRTPSGHIVFDRSPSCPDTTAIIASEVRRERREYCSPSSLDPLDQVAEIFYEYPVKLVVRAECWAPKRRTEFETSVVAELVRMLAAIKNAGLASGLARIWPHPVRPSEDEWIYCTLWEAGKTEGGQSVRLHKELQQFIQNFSFELNSDLGNASAVRDLGKFLPLYLTQVRSSSARKSTSSSSPSSSLTPSNPDPDHKKPPTASQMLARLRWDPAHAAQSYEVGYMDRFVGLLWTPLENWGHATEEEEFIPEHRIRVIRRIGGDAAVVWERRGKLDGGGGLIC